MAQQWQFFCELVVGKDATSSVVQMQANTYSAYQLEGLSNKMQYEALIFLLRDNM
jgi:hypothetical protein